MSPRSLPCLGALLFTLAGLGSAASAQDLSTAVTRRAVRAAVKITAEGPRGQVSNGSGSVIDPRGYVLTNFHVVGHTSPGFGTPGSFINARNEVRISMVSSARDAAQER